MKVRPVAIIWCAIALHTLWGCLLLISGEALGATALHGFADLPRLLTAAILFAVAGLAAVATLRVTMRGPRVLTLVLLLPQQAVLTVSATSSVMAVIHGRYADGVPRPWYFILADQAPVILTMALHTIAVVQLHLTSATTDDLRAKLAAVQEDADRLRAKLADRHGELAGNGRPGAAGAAGGDVVGESAAADRDR